MRTTPDNSDMLIKNNSSADKMAKAVGLKGLSKHVSKLHARDITGDGSRL